VTYSGPERRRGKDRRQVRMCWPAEDERRVSERRQEALRATTSRMSAEDFLALARVQRDLERRVVA
jgi:hypothetical protein